MPDFAGVLNDQQLAELLVYLRSRFSDKPPWSNVDADIRAARSGQRPIVVASPHGTDPATGVQHEDRP
jgi:hypothetical protein